MYLYVCQPQHESVFWMGSQIWYMKCLRKKIIIHEMSIRKWNTYSESEDRTSSALVYLSPKRRLGQVKMKGVFNRRYLRNFEFDWKVEVSSLKWYDEHANWTPISRGIVDWKYQLQFHIGYSASGREIYGSEDGDDTQKPYTCTQNAHSTSAS